MLTTLKIRTEKKPSIEIEDSIGSQVSSQTMRHKYALPYWCIEDRTQENIDQVFELIWRRLWIDAY